MAAGRAIGMDFDTPDGLVDIYEMTTGNGDPINVDGPVQRIDPRAPTARTAVIDGICWVLAGAAASP